jgi:AcrR family transcriptional regulator
MKPSGSKALIGREPWIYLVTQRSFYGTVQDTLVKSRTTETQSAILDATIELFSTTGFEVTPMDAISAAANVAKGTLYYHFDSKEGIVNAIAERDAAAVEARLASIETDLKLSFVDKFTASVGADLLIHEVTNKELALHINIKQ